MRLPADLLKTLTDGDLEGLQRRIHEEPALLLAADEDERGLLHHAVLARKHAIIHWILAEQDDYPILATDEAGWSVLHLAASIGDVEAVSQILCHPAGSKLLNAKNESGCAPLHYASSKGHFQVVSVLLENQADVLVENRYGQTALHRASALGHAAIIKALIEAAPLRLRSSFIDGQDREGNTALHLAAQESQEEAIRALIEAGAQRDIKNKEGHLAL